MGLAKTPGGDEGGPEIKPATGVDDTGMGTSGLSRMIINCYITVLSLHLCIPPPVGVHD